MTTAPTIEYLRALRRRQLGEDAGDVEALAREAEAANKATVKDVRITVPREARLHFTTHGLQRMAQRGLRRADVLAIYLNGESEPDHSGRGRKRYRITERALAHCDGAKARALRKYMGDVVVVADPNQHGPLYAVITVLPFGER